VIGARVLVEGTAAGEALRLDQGISFWGAVDPASGRIIDHRHPQHGALLAGRVLLVPRSLGSSSGSAVLLELLRRGCGPAGIILGEADQILTLGAVVAREMGYAQIPVLLLEEASFDELVGPLSIDAAGVIGAGVQPPAQ